MDLLFKRYADPFLFINQMLSCGRFSEFVAEFEKIIAEETDEKTLWEYFLHKVYDKSFDEFKNDVREQIKMKNTTKADLEATVRESSTILDGFNPESEGGA